MLLMNGTAHRLLTVAVPCWLLQDVWWFRSNNLEENPTLSRNGEWRKLPNAPFSPRSHMLYKPMTTQVSRCEQPVSAPSCWRRELTTALRLCFTAF
jgi:hypothetical protein